MRAVGQHPRSLPLPSQPGWALQTPAGFVLPSTKAQEFLGRKCEIIYFSVYLNRGELGTRAARLLCGTAAFIDIFLPLQQGNK